MRCIVALAAVNAVSAQAPTWFGLTPARMSPTPGVSTLDLVDLTDAALVRSTIGHIDLGHGEFANWDALRCLPGLCLFTTTTYAAGAPSSFVYRVSTADASIAYKVAVPGVCAHMHADFTSGHAYTLCLTATSATVVEVTGTAPIQVADVTAAIGSGSVLAGQTTHCSAFKHLYIGVSHGGAGKDAVVAVDLVAGRVDATTRLSVPLFDAM